MLSERLGISQFFLIIIGIVGLIFNNLVSSIYYYLTNNSLYIHYLLYFIMFLFLIYFILVLFTIYVIKSEKNRLNLNIKMKIKVTFFHPLFLLSYIPCFIKAITSKDLGWQKIEHHSKEIIK